VLVFAYAHGHELAYMCQWLRT